MKCDTMNMNMNIIIHMLSKYITTHPNLCKLWLHRLMTDQSSNNLFQAYQALSHFKDMPDFSKFEILTIYNLYNNTSFINI